MILPLLVGAGALVVSMLLYGLATALLIRLVVYLIHRGYAGPGVWRNVLITNVVTLLTAAMHLTQIALWALVFLGCGELGTFEQAFYASAENYTALGYGDAVLLGPWRLLGPLEAINGLLLFGLSTAVLFAVLSHLFTIRLRHQSGEGPKPLHR
jgi:hypothetical protein